MLAYVADFSNLTAWDPSALAAARLDEGPLAPGSRFRVTVRFAGRPVALEYAIDTLEPALAVLEAATSRLLSRDEIRVAADPRGTRLEYRARLELKGALARLDGLLQPALDRIGVAAACGLARALDAREQTSPRDARHRLCVAREVDAPAAAAWRLLTDTQTWPRWGPSVRAVESAQRFIAPGSRGRVQARFGPWLPFEVTRWTEREWQWRVAGVQATSHRVTPLGDARCRIEFGVPGWALAYLAICRQALGRIARDLVDDRGAGL